MKLKVKIQITLQTLHVLSEQYQINFIIFKLNPEIQEYYKLNTI